MVSAVRAKRDKSAEHVQNMYYFAGTQLPNLTTIMVVVARLQFATSGADGEPQTSWTVEGWAERENKDRDWTVKKGRPCIP